jgi:hypothetical protein
MVTVDPVSGLPQVEPIGTTNQSLLDRFGAQKAKADLLLHEVESEKGKEILNKIHAHLMARVNELVNNDGECKALKRLLIDMGVTIDVGKVAADRLVSLVTKK